MASTHGFKQYSFQQYFKSQLFKYFIKNYVLNTFGRPQEHITTFGMDMSLTSAIIKHNINIKKHKHNFVLYSNVLQMTLLFTPDCKHYFKKSRSIKTTFFCFRMVVVISMARSSLCHPLLLWRSTWLMHKTLRQPLLGHRILATFMKSQCQWVWKQPSMMACFYNNL